MSLPGCLAALALLFWIAVALDPRRRFPAGLVLEDRVREGETGAGAAGGGAVVIVPARNEEKTLPKTLEALLRQHEDFLHLYVVDDGSEDGTKRAAGEAIEKAGVPQACVLSAPPPPAGWSGKVHALSVGVARAVEDHGPAAEWFYFVDADILHPPGSLRKLRRLAQDEQRDLVSVMVRLRAESFWERLLIPPFVFYFHLLYPFRAVASARSQTAAAAGGTILLRRDLLEALGGLESIRGEIIDDVALARRAKKAGGRLWLGLTREIHSLRAYDGYLGIQRMVARTAFRELRESVLLVALACSAVLFFASGPPILAALAALSADLPGAAAAGGAWGIQAILLTPWARHLLVPAGYAVLFPAASFLYAWMTCVSAWWGLTHRGSGWRGRRT